MSVLRVIARLATPPVLRDAMHLDALLAAARVERDTEVMRIHRATSPEHLIHPALPVLTIEALGATCAIVSAEIVGDDARRGLDHLVRRKDSEDIDRRAGTWQARSGAERAYCLPLPLIETASLEWLAVGDRREVLRMLQRKIPAVGIVRRHGHGRVLEWTVERVDLPPERVLVDEDGRALRHLPRAWCAEAEAEDVGAWRAPYWHPTMCGPRVPRGTRCVLAPEVLRRLERAT